MCFFISSNSSSESLPGFNRMLSGIAILPISCSADALTISDDCSFYKDPFAVEEAARMILEGECGVFSPEMLDCFRLAKQELFAVTEGKFSQKST